MVVLLLFVVVVVLLVLVVVVVVILVFKFPQLDDITIFICCVGYYVDFPYEMIKI